ncbi:MAG: hypothetical protein FWB78_12935, partial [Treponema sp.]|nr:hypothetical protein [Treponema sp.]
PYSAFLFVMTLNYEGTWKKRFVAVFFIFAVGVAIEYAAPPSTSTAFWAAWTKAARSAKPAAWPWTA